MPRRREAPRDDIFVNCPFDEDYQPVFQAILFAISDCGFRPRTTLECNDSGRVRLDKLIGIITDCGFGIHDLSRTELDARHKLPRFNMPFELGLFLGARYMGAGKQRSKKCLILDRRPYRYQKFISDIAGQDIQGHDCRPNRAIAAVRDWIRATSGRQDIPGAGHVKQRYRKFLRQMPALCEELRLDQKTLPYADYNWLMAEWLKKYRTTTFDL